MGDVVLCRDICSHTAKAGAKSPKPSTLNQPRWEQTLSLLASFAAFSLPADVVAFGAATSACEAELEPSGNFPSSKRLHILLLWN